MEYVSDPLPNAKCSQWIVRISLVVPRLILVYDRVK